MKNKRHILRRILSLPVLLSIVLLPLLSALSVRAEGDEDKETVTLIEIRTKEDLADLAIHCHDDAWSYDKEVCLKEDIVLTGSEFSSIPSFNGIFDGGGHTISNYRYTGDGYISGFFLQLGENAVVKNLTLDYTIRTDDDAQCTGGLAGINAGRITNCTVKGYLFGSHETGGIVGINQKKGYISACTNKAQVMGFYYTGGIAGKNYGTLEKCHNRGNINSNDHWVRKDDENAESPFASLTEDTADIISLHSGVDTGGIAGFSEGIIHGCGNASIVGYEHVGYNVGGIVGRQSGIVSGCRNEGEIYGKKDVGGIVGQQEPYIEVDRTKSVRFASESLSDSVDTLIANAEASEEGVSADMRRLKEKSDALKQNVDALSSKEEVEKPEHIEPDETPEPDLKLPDRTEVKDAVGDLDLREDAEEWKKDTESLLKDMSEVSSALSDLGATAADSAETLSEDVQNIQDRVDSVYNLMGDLLNGAEESGVDYFFSDLSEGMLAENTTGRTDDCVNKGAVFGDIDVGGILGAMAVDDENLESNRIVTYGLKAGETYGVINVVTESTNEGRITSRKNNAGGIVGLIEKGIADHCYGYGDITAEEGDYLGGIAGRSQGMISSCYALCTLTGNNDIGGIAGSSVGIRNCVSMPVVINKGGNIGAIAGEIPRDKLTKEDDRRKVRGNRFVSEELYGIDAVSYRDSAEKYTYKELCQDETLPDAFRHLKILFYADGERIHSAEAPYGAKLSEIEYPEAADREGYYVVWPEYTDETLRGNLYVEAEYLPYINTIASEETDEVSGKVLVYAGGDYTDQDSVWITKGTPEELSRLLPGNKKAGVVYTIGVSESDETRARNEGRTYDLRLYKPFDKVNIYRIDTFDDGRKEAVKIPDTEERGEYLLLSMEGREVTYAVTEAPGLPLGWIIVGGTILLLGIVFILVIKKVKAGKAKKAKEAEE